jgi:hypothetical protein
VLEILKYVLWIGAPIVQGYLLGVMVRRGLRRDFPAFFAYTVFALISFVANFTTCHYSYKLYFCVFWISSIINVGMAFAVIREIFYTIFRPFDSLRDLAQVLFKWVSIVMLVVAVVGVISAGHAGAIDRLMQTMYVIERSVYVMQVGLLLFLFLFSGLVGLTARSHVFGVALGFGIFAAGNLLYFTIFSAFGISSGASAFVLLKMLFYNASCIIWLSYLHSPDPERMLAVEPARSMELHLALQTAGQSSHENFMPMIEDLVGRVLEKRQSGTHIIQ